MKKILAFLFLFTLTISTFAEAPEEQRKFNPEQFMKEQEGFISREAKLTPQEAQAFFPVFREMQDKQRALFIKQKQLSRSNPQDEKAAAELIKNIDNIEMQIKKLQIQYHAKFLKILPAIKVYKCIKAEEHHKQMIMDRMSQFRNNKKR